MRAFMLGSLILVASSGAAMAQDGPPEGAPPGEWRPDGPPPLGAGRRGPLFISPMGEPFRGAPGAPPPHEAWFDGADIDHDGALREDEMVADAARFFALLDQRRDGEIDPDDVERYETVLAPEIRTGEGAGGPRFDGHRPGGAGGRRGGPGGPGGEGRGPEGMAAPRGGERAAGTKQGAARFGYLDYPEPVTVADRNLNRGIDAAEFARAASARFAMLDANHDRKIEKGELPKLRSFGSRPPRDGGKGARAEIPQ